ncbi:helix-turn-helix domain-containing protein [Streptomyces sp. NPDC096048]|uniref:helix-turn-helix domain-containing protein n=1 Tax=Streptomyces sp. NPDC096048 TaxID=3366072 RepID=UPI0037F57CB6
MAGDDFAVLLRELKERSGLSYGALGKRLHMSASTLHRYVSGEVVPTEFAPVERLARVCRATPEELLELHRRWIRADALRGVKKEETEEKETEEEQEQTLAPLTPHPLTASGAPTAPPTPREPDPPRRRVPRAALYAATGVVAVSAAVALVANLVSGTGDDGRRGPAGALAQTSATVSGTATGPASPSASASSSPSVSSSRSGSRSPSPSASPSRPGTASPSREALADGPALAVSTNPYHWDVPCEHAFLVDRSPQNVLPPPAQRDAVGWATTYGAVSANRQMAVLTVQGTGEETVVLHDLHVRVVSSKPALDWKQYVMGNGCGGGVTPKSFDVALDLGNPLAMPVSGQQDFPYTVTESDIEVFNVNAHTSGHDVSWYLELEWSSGHRHGVMRVDDHGKPFRTSASRDDSYYAYPLGGDGWELVEDD